MEESARREGEGNGVLYRSESSESFLLKRKSSQSGAVLAVDSKWNAEAWDVRVARSDHAAKGKWSDYPA